MRRRRIGILGGGISGVSLAAHLDEDVDVLEKHQTIGGLCGAVAENGFTFDAAGPHIMFSKNKDVLQLMVSVLGENVHKRRRENKIWFKGRLVKYPFENDLASLPKEDNFECIYGYLRNPWQDQTPTNLAEWSYVTFGKGISEKYFIPYNRKVWNHDPADMGLEFVSRIPKPPLEDVLKSAIGIPTEGYLHQLYFYYPSKGGFEAIARAFASRVRGEITTGWRITSVRQDGDGWRVTSDSTEERWYQTLVSTLPIHELLAVWNGAPQQAQAAAKRLRYNSLINVLLGFSEDRDYRHTAIYVPDPEIIFHRISFPKTFSEHNVPSGCSAIMAEITINESDGVWETSDTDIMDRVIGEIERMGFCNRETLIFKKVVRFVYGYPVYDLQYHKNVKELRDAVAAAGIRLLGRFAQFDYINSDVCVERAIALARELRGSE